jgi:hypothetical protein
VNILPVKCKAMLLKQAKPSKKLVNWIMSKEYSKWNMEQFLKNVEEAKVYKLEASKFILT